MPDWTLAIRERLAANLDGGRESEIIEELSRHLDDRYRELRATGVPHEQACRLAADELDGGELRAIHERSTCRPAAVGAPGGRSLFTSLWHDLNVALRMLRNRPGFASAVAFMLALGIAGNTAIFSIYNGMCLRPMPFAEPARLVDLDETAPKWNLRYVGVSNYDFNSWQNGNSAFAGMAFFGGGGANLSDGSGVAQRIRTANVTWTLLPVLGLKPLVGRNFTAEEDRPGGAKVLLLGYDLWQRLFQGDRAVLGRTLKLDGRACTVVGVLPREAVLPPNAEAWTPLAADPKRGTGWYLSGVGRLKPGVSLDQARADLLRVHRAEIQKGQKVNEITSPVLQPLRDRYVGDVRPIMHILLAAVGVVLLIACVNIAGLMLVRGEARVREIAIRTAIGASRWRVVRQLLTESLLLAAIGSAIGIGAGALGLRGLVSLMPADTPKWVQFPLDGRFALFAVALTVAAAVLFGLAPALHAAAAGTTGFLNDSARSSLSPAKRRTLSALVVCEIALALVLLVSSGLLFRAFRNVLRVDPGFRPANVITWTLRPPDAAYPKAEQRYALFAGLLDRLRSVPGVVSASAAAPVPLSGHSGYFFRVENGRGLAADEKDPVVLRIVAMPGYVETMGMTLLAGRDFNVRDESEKAPQVAIVNESFARFFWGNADVVGKRIRYSWTPDDWMQVAGIIRDTRHYGLDGDIRPSDLVPFRKGQPSAITFVLRTSLEPGSIVGSAREIVRQVDPDLPMFDIETMAERIDHSLWMRRASSWLFAAFAAVAIILACAGIYGVISFAVSRRTREIGIRIALGARPRQVVAKILGGGMLLVAVGVAIGLIVSLLTVRFLRTMLFGVAARDVATYAAVAFGVILVGFLANYLPARRAAAVDPVRALRAE